MVGGALVSGGIRLECGCRQWAKTGRKSLKRYRRSEAVVVVMMEESEEEKM